MKNSIFDKNIAALITNGREDIVDMLNNEKVIELSDSNIMIANSEVIQDRTILYVQKDDSTIQLDSLYDSEMLMDCWMSQCSDIVFNSKLLMFGFGNGMYVRKFLREIPETGAIIIYEPSIIIFKYVLNTFDVSDLLENKNLVIFLGSEVINKNILFKYFTYHDIKGLIFLDYLNYRYLFPNEYKKFYAESQILVNSINATNTVWERFGEAYYYNTLSNFPYLVMSKSLYHLYVLLPKDIPAILVSSGPSLDKNISELKKAKGKAFVISVDSALKALLKEDIIPDMFITVDGRKMTAHFEDERVSKIPMVCSLTSNSEVLNLHHSHKFFVNDLNTHIDFIIASLGSELPILQGSGSVANSAYSLLEILGFKTIIMVGQDLAYTDNKTHAASTVRGAWNLDISEEAYIEVDGYCGGRVRSSNEFLLYLDWFEKEIAENPNVRMINATEGGATIHGAEQMSLREALERECRNDIDLTLVFENVTRFFSEEQAQLFCDKIMEAINETKEIISISKRAVDDYYKMIQMIHANKYHSKEFVKLYEKTKQYGKRIESISSLYYIDCRIQNKIKELTENIYITKQNEKEELLEAINKGKEYLEVIRDAAIEILPDLTNRIHLGLDKFNESKQS